ncbi:low molecular weight phosphatase family protein [Povalibacter sp.]|uniref:arsenate-mycothiol transferase ArsC n=1 Tax=Povalibacter sp. TaxID=1962978 RepID=UPI002F41584B
MPLRILIVCAANRFRSPLAEHLLRRDWAEHQVEVASAGVQAVSGQLVHPMALELAVDNGLFELQTHLSRRLTPSMIRAVDLVLTMDELQQREVLKTMAAFTGRVLVLGGWRGVAIEDPVENAEVSGKDTFELLRACLGDWKERLQVSGLLPLRSIAAADAVQEMRHAR